MLRILRGWDPIASDAVLILTLRCSDSGYSISEVIHIKVQHGSSKQIRCQNWPYWEQFLTTGQCLQSYECLNIHSGTDFRYFWRSKLPRYSDDDESCPVTISTIESVSAVAPMCDTECAQVNYHALLGPKYYVYYYLLGPMTLTKSDITGDQTFYSDNMGAINDLQPLLCNYTAATGNTTATVFQYDSETEEFTRVISTVPDVRSTFLLLLIILK